ncbi:MAG: PQQ-binding-like beta-propeller repeat protein [Candidatus Woesearchaeota archaeon]|nr:PQQ-binding-like beta-propeller repeat protein [Candidatus Woesearchaeota archaeon]
MNNSKQQINFNAYDLNNNNLIDYIEWTVPHLSNQTYELEIVVLNIHSYPPLGGNWTVMFNTSGTGNLTITATQGTTYSEMFNDNQSTSNDLEILELKCGDNILFNKYDNLNANNTFILLNDNSKTKLTDTTNQSLAVNGLFVENYNCDNKTAYHTIKELTTGSHYQLLNFSGQLANAQNLVTVHNWNNKTIDTSGNHSWPTDLVAPDPNTIYIAYLNKTDEAVIFANSSDGGETWSTKYLHDANWQNTGSISIDAINRSHIYLTFNNQTGPWLTYSTDFGQTWDSKRADTSNDQKGLDIEVLDENNIFIVYDDAGNDVRVLNTSDGGDTWSEVEAWDSLTLNPYGISTDVLNKSHIYIAAANFTNGDLVFIKSTDGGRNWINRSIYDNWGRDPIIKVVDENNIHIAFVDGSGTGDVYLTSTTDGGDTWNALPVTSSNQERYIDMDILSNDIMFISYFNDSNDNLGIAKTIDGGSTWTHESIDTEGDVGRWTSIDAVGEDNVFIAYINDDEDALRFARTNVSLNFSFTLNSPADNLFSSNTTIIFNWTVINNLDSTFECNLTINNLVNISNVLTTSRIATNVTVTGFNISTHNWNITCIDDIGNTNSSETRSFSIDTAPRSSDSANLNEWRMDGRTLNGTHYYPGAIPDDISQLEVRSYAAGASTQDMSIADGYLWAAPLRLGLVKLNATNVSQLIDEGADHDLFRTLVSPVWDNFVYAGSESGAIYQYNTSNLSHIIATNTLSNAQHYSSPIVYERYVYFTDWHGTGGNFIYQANASNVSQIINSFSFSSCKNAPIIYMGYLYHGCGSTFLQLNATNVSIEIARYSAGGSFDTGIGFAAANGYVYLGNDDDKFYQLNASNVSIKIADYTTGGDIDGSPAVANGFVYIGSNDGYTYQLNASNVSQQIANYSTGAVNDGVSVTDDYLLVGGNGAVWQLEASDISQFVANYTISGPGTPTIAGGIIYFSSGSTYYQLGTGEPVTTLNAPDDNYEFGQSLVNVSFNCSAYDGIGLKNISLFLTNSSNQSFSLNQSSTLASTTNSSAWTVELAEGNYTWNCLTFDTDGKFDWATNRSMGSDRTIPTITIDTPANNTFTIDNNLDINYTVTDQNPDSCWYSNDSMTTNTSLTNCTTNIVSVTWTEKQHNVTIWVNDTVGNIGNASVTFTIDDTNPSFTNISNQTAEYGTALGYDINATDSVGVNCFTVNDTTNFKINCSGFLENNTVLGLNLYSLNITINDSAGNLNLSLMWVNVSDTTPPNFTSILNQSIFDLDALAYDINASDIHNVSCFGVNDSSFKINCSGYLENNTALNTTAYWLNISVNDSSGNFNYEFMWVNITLKPVIGLELIAPTKNMNATQGVFFNVTVNISCSRADCDEINVSLDPFNTLIFQDEFERTDLGGNWTASGSGTWETSTTCTELGTYSMRHGGSLGTVTSKVIDLSGYDAVNFSYWVKEADGCANAPESGDDFSVEYYNSSGSWVELNSLIGGSPYYKDVVIHNLSSDAFHADFQIRFNAAGTAGNYDYWNIDNLNITGRPIKNGLVSMSTSAVPFYTNTTNPFNITLSNGSSSLITWSVNATGDPNSIHEFYVYANKTSKLSLSNLTQIWNVTIIAAINDFTSPTIPNLTDPSPIDNLNTTNTTFNFNWTVTDEADLSLSCDLVINGDTNGSSIATPNATGANYTVTGFNDGTYVWNVTCTDDGSNSNTSVTRTFTVDTFQPVITLDIPANNTWQKDGNVTIKYTTTDSNLDSCILYGNFNGSWLANQTNTSVTSGVQDTFNLNLTNGTYLWNVWCNDTLGNEGFNNTYNSTFYIDTILPAITLNGPIQNFNTSASNIEFNWTAIDNLDPSLLCNLTINDLVNESLISSNNGTNTNITVTGFQDGSYLWNITCIDNTTNINTSITRNLTVDLTAPQLYFDASTLNASTYYSQNYIFVNVSVTETNLKNITYYLYNSSGLEINQTYTSQTFTHNFTSLKDGAYSINVTIFDQAGNSNSTPTRTDIILDTLYPAIEFVNLTPENNTYQLETYVIINTTITETNLKEVKYGWNNTNYTMYNDSLVLMMNFDNVSSLGENNTYVVDISGNDYNGTALNGPVINSTGKYTGAIHFDGDDDHLQIPTITFANDFAISFWWNINHDSKYRFAISEDSTGSSVKIGHNDDGSNFFVRVINGGSSDTSVSLPSENEWHYITVVRDSSDKVDLYIDDSTPTRLFSDAAQNGNSVWSVIGRGASDLGQYINGTLDELRIWNRTLNANQVYQQYISNLKKIDTDKWELYVNQSKNSTVGLENGSYTYQVIASDIAENTNSTEERTIIIDTTPPTINLDLPLNNTWQNDESVAFKYTPTDPAGIDTCTLYGNFNGSWLSNESDSSVASASQSTFNINLSDGIYIWNVLCNDTAGSSAFNSTNLTINIDTLPPTINLSAPVNEYNSSNSSVQFNWTAIDNLDINLTCNLTINNQVNVSLIESTNNSIMNISVSGFKDDTYYWNVTCMDNATNVNTSETRIFRVDLDSPSINLISPINNSGDTDGNLSFNYIVDDTSPVTNCSLIINDEINITNNSITKSITQSFTLYNFATNNYNWSINCTDNYNQTNQSEERTITAIPTSEYLVLNLTNVNMTNITNFYLKNDNYGLINFTNQINLQSGIDIDSNVNISNNRIELNSTAIPTLNIPATLYLYNLTFTNPRILKDDSPCDSSICTKIDYTDGTLEFTVTQFSVYSADETPIPPTPTPVAAAAAGGGGGGGGVPSRYKCNKDSECDADEKCIDKICVKLFDAKVIRVDSPIEPGELLDFTYYIKGMANISGDVIVNFWLEHNNKTITSSSDTIYLNSYEDKTESTYIPLPLDLERGTYTFYVEVNYLQYKARAHRQIEIMEGAPSTLDFNLLPIKETSSAELFEFSYVLATNKDITTTVFVEERIKEKGKIIWSKDRHIDVARTMTLTEPVGTLKAGVYQLELSTTHQNKTTRLEHTFTIERSVKDYISYLGPPERIFNFLILIILGVIAVYGLYGLTTVIARETIGRVKYSDYLKNMETELGEGNVDDFLSDLQNKIRNYQNKGYNKRKIENALSKSEWPKVIVERQILDMKKEEKSFFKLVKYIEKELKKGIKPLTIKSILSKYGWNPYLINKAFRKIKK